MLRSPKELMENISGREGGEGVGGGGSSPQAPVGKNVILFDFYFEKCLISTRLFIS